MSKQLMGEIIASAIGRPLMEIRLGIGLIFTKVAKVAQNRFPLVVPRFRGIHSFQSKVDQDRESLTCVKSAQLAILSPSMSVSMLVSESASSLFCKEQRNTKPWYMLFHIQMTAIERDGPLLTKEVLWKR